MSEIHTRAKEYPEIDEGETAMAYEGKGSFHPNHPFAHEQISFVPKQTSLSTNLPEIPEELQRPRLPEELQTPPAPSDQSEV